MNCDLKYMKMALKLAEKGKGYVKTNPLVGAVIVKNGVVLAMGYHRAYGEYHAERNAILNLKTSSQGAMLYVNLEPCVHYGKTPPCTDIIIDSGIERVVVGTLDPNPIVAGRGIDKLRKNGIIVDVGVMEKQCKKLNEIFFHNMETKMPFVALKFGMTLDGKIATSSGMSKWITNEKARKHSHFLRSIYSGILVGINTVIEDDPKLNCRLIGKRNPVRIVCDTNLRIPLNCNIVKMAKKQKTYVVCSIEDNGKINKLEKAGVEVINVGKVDGHIDLKQLLFKLYDMGIDSVLVEGGSEINYSFVKSGLINAVYSYVSPKLVGGSRAKTPTGGSGIRDLNDAINLKNENIKLLDDNILLEYRSARFGK